MGHPHQHPALDLAKKRGLVRARELYSAGAKGGTLDQMLKEGLLVRVARGLYAPSNRQHKEFDELGPIAIKHSNLVFCLLTALQLHGLTTQTSHQIWVAIGQKARTPSIEIPPLRVVRMKDVHFGVTTLSTDGIVQIPVTDIAKTIADCFKFRNKIGIDIALEALKSSWQQKKVLIDDIWIAAEHCRVTNVMRPYLESLV